MPRLPHLNISDLSTKQMNFVESITKGKRGKNRTTKDFIYEDGSLKGPFNAWLYSSEIGQRAQKLGEALRFDSAIPATLREAAILSVAVFWKSQYEWWAHVRIARKEGLDETVINAILTGEEPTETELGVQAVTAFARETLNDKRVTDATFADAMARLGERGIVDLTTLLGYYCMVSASLNVFQVPVPKGEEAPFAE